MTKKADSEAILTRRAPQPGASSWSEKDRTFRAVIAAGAPVVRYDWDGAFTERLDPAGVELATDVPFLNSHRTGRVADVIGKVEKVERVGDRLEAVIRLSRRPEVDAIATDIRDGILSGMSVGYSVSHWLDEEGEDGTRTKTATAWRLLEVSAVAVPADDKARIREREQSMNHDANVDVGTKPVKITRAIGEVQLRAFAQQAGLPNDWVDENLEAGVTREQMHTSAVDYFAEQQRRGPQIQSTGPALLYGETFDNPETRAAAMSEAIAARALPSFEPSPAARSFVGMSLPEMARESLRIAGMDTRGMSPGQVVTRALGGLHTTSDFAHALSGAAHVVLRNAYESAPSGLKPLARRVTLNDFRAKTFVSLSGFSALEKVGEHGEFRRGTVHDGGEHIRLNTFGKIFGITRQAIVNDDIGFIADIPRRLGQAASQFEAAKLAELLLANPVMGDGKALFHADHSNLASAGGAPSETTLSAARKALRTQTDDAGQLIGLAPRWLVVGPDLETDVEKLMAAITATATDDVQPIRLSIAVEPRISGKSWHVAADPSACDGLIYAHLANEPGPQIEHRVGFDVDGVEFKIRLDFGAAFVDHRAWYRNPGAA